MTIWIFHHSLQKFIFIDVIFFLMREILERVFKRLRILIILQQLSISPY
jgi:hypothetical protein